MKLFGGIVCFAFLSVQLLISQDQPGELGKYIKMTPQELRDEILRVQNPKGGGLTKAIDIARLLLKDKNYDLFKIGLEYYVSRVDFEVALNEMEDSVIKDDIKLYMLRNDRYFFDYDGPGSRGVGGSQAQPYLYLFAKYLPGIPIDPQDFDYPAKRKPLVDKLEAAMEEKRKPRELRRPEASDFEEQSSNHVGKVGTSKSSSADASDFLKPVPIGIAAGIAALLALLGWREFKRLN